MAPRVAAVAAVAAVPEVPVLPVLVGRWAEAQPVAVLLGPAVRLEAVLTQHGSADRRHRLYATNHALVGKSLPV